ncbi:50S ribosomal protein L31 [Olsenella porci]|jgi:large subunit ribosomal protein L31|uniref:Large ribosomal subunit protein bL31 n=1 Tax=Olsenella porci TaxID=2652279 RepID=A0A6N7XN89_9ACTN|nr:50S ribosomal protein L31 [Olsenella porci]MCC6099368.1 50S ribosomal protein L31 [Olsenella sp.]MCI1997427.1 50S ribosomal protein L31 [Olsenella sp.]MST71535.1 50S ribosomal protein L31 [Olsenella porci]
MKQGIHPDYVMCTVRCTCGNTWVTRSTKSEMTIDLCDKCHPFYTGQQKLVDTGGRVQRFSDKFGGAAQAQLAKAKAAKEAKAKKAAEEEAARKAAAEAKAAAKAKRAAEYAKKAEAEAAKKAAEEAAEAETAEATVAEAAPAEETPAE